MRPRLADIATGKWPGILRHFGFDDGALTGKHGPCPLCGGRDRFRFDDKAGRGTWICSHCGAGDGAALLMRSRAWDFATTARQVEQIVGAVATQPAKAQRSDDQKRAALRRVWAEAKPVHAGDPVGRYLAGRGLALDSYPPALRYHEGLTYRDSSGLVVGTFPAMLARICDADDKGICLHRTYLTADGRKAPVESPKKMMSPTGTVSGAAIRLSGVAEHIGIAEGIETALAAAQLFGIPTWATVTAHGVETFIPPAGVNRVTVFADNDANFVGQRAAYVAAARLAGLGIECEVQTPEEAGDWLDVLTQKGN